MDKKRSAFAAPDAGRMTDAELSKRLGGLQRRSAAWLLVGLAGAVSGTVCFFAVQDALLRAILVTVLFFGGVCWRRGAEKAESAGARAAGGLFPLGMGENLRPGYPHAGNAH